MGFPSREVVERIRGEYPAGTRVELLRMDDVQAPPIGTKGTVTGVDDTASVMVAWDNGSHLHAIYGEDKIRRIPLERKDNGMNAKQAFGKLGYTQVRADDDYIIYEKEIDGGDDKKVVDFCSQLENFRVSFESGMDTPSIDIGLFKAISVQLAELGWAQ